MYGSDFDSLKGKKISFAHHNDEKLWFDLGDKVVSFNAIGDCCSTSFIESMDNLGAFDDAIFDSVEIVSNNEKEISEFEYHKWTFYKFKTNKGMCTLSFRNESNGYYDGWLEKEDT